MNEPTKDLRTLLDIKAYLVELNGLHRSLLKLNQDHGLISKETLQSAEDYRNSLSLTIDHVDLWIYQAQPSEPCPSAWSAEEKVQASMDQTKGDAV